MQLMGGVNVAIHAKGAQSCFHCLRVVFIDVIRYRERAGKPNNKHWFAWMLVASLAAGNKLIQNTVSTEFHTDEQWGQHVLNSAYVS